MIPADKLVLSSDCGFGRQGFNRLVAFYKAAGIAQGRNIVLKELGLRAALRCGRRPVTAAGRAARPRAADAPAVALEAVGLVAMPDAPDRKRGVQRKDADGNLQVGTSWESLVERQIREAMEQGKFDDLPLKGKPLPNDDNPYAGEWSLAYKMLKNAGVAPPWIEADKEVRRLLEQRDANSEPRSFRSGADELPAAARPRRARGFVRRINEAIARVNAESPNAVQHRRRWCWRTSWPNTTRPAPDRLATDSRGGARREIDELGALLLVEGRVVRHRQDAQGVTLASGLENPGRGGRI